MPPKIRDLESAGFRNRGGKGIHRDFHHPCGARVTISGKLGADAIRYQIRNVARAIDKVSDEEE